jgi:hypothetical protein
MRALPDAIIVRVAESSDVHALERLAAPDSKPLPRGALVVADTEGEIVATATLAGNGEAVCDAFRPTQHLTELLELATSKCSVVEDAGPLVSYRASAAAGAPDP